VCWGEGEVVHVWKVKEECACVMGGVFMHGLINTAVFHRQYFLEDCSTYLLKALM